MGGIRRALSRSSRYIVVLLVLMATLAGCLQSPATPTPSPTPAAPPLPPVRGGAGGAAATASGKVVPVRQAGLSLATAGRVQEVNIAVGDQVEADSVLLVMDNAAATAAVAQARAGLLRAQAYLDELEAGPRPQEIAAAEARLAAAQAHLAQLTEAARPEAIDAARAELAAMQAQYDALYTTPDSAAVATAWANVQAAQAALDRLLNPATESQIAEAEAQVQSAQAELDLLAAGPTSQTVAAATAAVAEAEATLQQAEAALAATQLTAPFAGTITSLDTNPGEMVQSGQVVMTLADLSHMQVETTDLSERDVVHVAVGRPVTVFIEALNTELAGQVARIAPQANVIGGDVVYAVLVDLDQQPPNLRWGMSAAVEIQAEQEE